ncbi:hypothetical protein L195_g023375, partial [Trifolium pratense]
MPLKFTKKWEIGELNINYEKEIVLADQSIIRPSGIMKDVIVKVNNMLFPLDFTIVDIEEDVDVPIILIRSFLATSRAVIDMEKEVLTLRMEDEEQLIYIRGGNDWCCRIESREPKNPGWRMKVTMEELEDGIAELDLDKKSYPPAIDIADVKKEDLWPAEVKWVSIPRKPKVVAKFQCDDRNDFYDDSSHLDTKKHSGDCLQRNSSRYSKTSKEDRVHEIDVQLSRYRSQ